MTADPDRLAGALICTGAVVGLVGSIATRSVLLRVPSFVIVLVLGVYAFRRRKEGRLLAAAVVGSPPWAPSGASLPSSSLASTACSRRATTGWPRFQSSGRRSPSRARWSSSSAPREPDAGRVPSAFSQDDREDVSVFQGMIEADLLARELGGLAPHVRVSESLPPVAVDRVAHHADVGILLHDHRIRHVRLFSLRLQEDAHESEGRVDLVLQAREADALLRGDRHELPA